MGIDLWSKSNESRVVEKGIIMKVVLMPRGRGTRISRLFPDTPKPLIPIKNTPVLEREICSLRD